MYIGETARRFAGCFREHLQNVEKATKMRVKPVAHHFNLPYHSHHNCQHDYLRTILAPRYHRKPQKSQTKIHLSIGFTLSTRDQWMPLIPLIYSQNSRDHISTNGKAPLHFHINLQQPTIPLFALTKGLRSKRYLSKSFTVVIQALSTCWSWFLSLSHRHSTTVPLETRNPFKGCCLLLFAIWFCSVTSFETISWYKPFSRWRTWNWCLRLWR